MTRQTILDFQEVCHRNTKSDAGNLKADMQVETSLKADIQALLQ